MVRFENLNQERFNGLLMPINEVTMSGHIKLMLWPGTWATQVELTAASTYFQVPLFYHIQTQVKPSVLKWHVVKLLYDRRKFLSLDLAGFPELVLPIKHFEVVYYPYQHYNCVVSASCMPEPKLVEEHTYANKDIL